MAKDQQRIEIARLDESTRLSGGGFFCFIMLLLGGVVTLIGIVLETSAIRSAASGAFWTGWNVLWGIGMLLGQRRTYTVSRPASEPKL